MRSSQVSEIEREREMKEKGKEKKKKKEKETCVFDSVCAPRGSNRTSPTPFQSRSLSVPCSLWRSVPRSICRLLWEHDKTIKGISYTLSSNTGNWKWNAWLLVSMTKNVKCNVLSNTSLLKDCVLKKYIKSPTQQTKRFIQLMSLKKPNNLSSLFFFISISFSYSYAMQGTIPSGRDFHLGSDRQSTANS